MKNNDMKSLVQNWFEKWESGDFHNLPLTDDFEHTSPFGTISGKEKYLKLVEDNRKKFLGYKFVLIDEIYEEDKACVRYTAVQGDFKLDVSEWYYAKGDLIHKIFAYYHIGDISEDRKLSNGD